MRKRKNTKFGRSELTSLIYKRLNRAITKSEIHQALNIIYDYMIENLSEGKSISIDHLGTFSILQIPSHKAYHFKSQKVEETEPRKTVRFRPHRTFKELIKERRERFLK